jgi:D-alanyl-D-alanine carboxypeptidase
MFSRSATICRGVRGIAVGLGLLAMGLLAGCGDDGGGSAAAIDRLVNQSLAEEKMPGLAVAVISSTEITTSVAGVRRADALDLVRESDLFHLGSTTKAMTATVAAALVQSGVIGWTTTVAEVFPELVATMRPEYQNVTLAQLLTHRGGVLPLTEPEELELIPGFLAAPDVSRMTAVGWLLQQSPAVAPGTTALYSNAGITLAAAMLERRSGQSYETLLVSQVMQPLSVVPQFGWPASGDAAQPWGHVLVDSTWVPQDTDVAGDSFPSVLTPAGNVSLSVSDFAKFVQSHLRGLRGLTSQITAQSYAYLHEPQGDFALGWFVIPIEGVLTSVHDGSAGTFYALMAIQPSRDRAVVVVSNGYSAGVTEEVNVLALKLLALSP